MELIRGLHNLKPEHRGCVATVGNFDGVHLGHQAVFAAVRAQAATRGMPSVVITFEPQPLEYFRPEQAPARLTRLREKLAAVRATGIDRVMLLEFGPRLAEMSAHDFIEHILVDGLDVRHLYVGDDFRFGCGREGDFGMLRSRGEDFGFGVESLDAVCASDCRISSTRIREALASGDLNEAGRLLGRPYSICGRVAHGDKRGRQIGFPTANIALHRRSSPMLGVFAIRVRGLDEQPLPGVANLGSRPTVEGGLRPRLEVHLFDFERDIYGAHIEVEFVERIREERAFDSFDMLRRQIERDVEEARSIFAGRS